MTKWVASVGGVLVLLPLLLLCQATVLSAATTQRAPQVPSCFACYLSQPPQLDGQLSEWVSQPASIVIGDDPQQTMRYTNWGGPLDASVKLWLAWDEQNLYLAAEIADNRCWNNQFNPYYLWSDDCLMVACDVAKDYSGGSYSKDDAVFGWGVLEGKTVGYNWQGPTAPQPLASGQAVMVSRPGGWNLEAALPWSQLGATPQAGLTLGFSCLFGDTDLEEHEGTLEWTAWQDWSLLHVPGPKIGPKRFGKLILGAKGSENKGGKREQNKQDSALLYFYQRQLQTATNAAQAANYQLWSGHCHASAGALGQAEAAYRKVLASYPDTPSAGAATAALANLLACTSRGGGAVALCESRLTTQVAQPDVVQRGVRDLAELLTCLYGHAGAGQELQACAEKVAAKPGLTAELQLAIARSFQGQGDNLAAIITLHGLLAKLDKGSAFRARAIEQLVAVASLALECGDADIVLLAFADKVIPEADLSAESLSLLSWAYQRKGEIRAARARMQELIARFPTHERAFMARMDLANSYLQTGEVGAAEKLLKGIYRHYPRADFAGEAGIKLGNIAQRRGNYQQAISYYRKVATSAAFTGLVRAQAYTDLGDLLGFRLKDFANAEWAYEQALRISTDERITKQAMQRLEQLYRQL